MRYFNQFGGQVKSRHSKQYAKSKHWDGEKFVNLQETSLDISWSSLPELLRKQIFEKKFNVPKRLIPLLPFEKDAFLEPSNKMKAIWYGHSVVMMRLNNKTLIIDPMFGDNASPIAPIATKRFSENTMALIDDFPEIDLVLFTHDHYDHLDYDSIQKLKPKVKHYFVAMGIGRHLIQWGISSEKITEFDWWQSRDFEGIEIVFTPSRHFSGRGLNDRFKSLWGGWGFKTKNERIYFSGDGGYGNHFKEIGNRLGPFDFGWMECGQYNENWHQLHMYPEEVVKAAFDAKVARAMPVHWGGFALAPHHWKDSITRFTKASESLGLPVLYSEIGALFKSDSNNSDKWWEAIN